MSRGFRSPHGVYMTYKLRTVIFTLICLVCSACAVPSIHPFYRIEDVRYDEQLIGTWSDSEGTESWRFTAGPERGYKVEQHDKSGNRQVFKAFLFRIGDREFIDVSPDMGQENEHGDHLLPTHLLMGVKMVSGRLQLSFMDPTWVKYFLRANGEEIKHTVKEGEVILTDTTDNLQAFIRRHLDTPGVFEASEALTRKGEQ